MHKQVLINVEATDMRVAMLEDGELVELFVERFNQENLLGNIYKGRVEGVIPGLKAVFVNIGLSRNAFLHFSDVLREYDLPLRGKPERLPPKDTQAKREAKEDEAFAEDDDFIPPPILPDEDEEGSEAAAKDAKKTKRPKHRSRSLHVGDSIVVQVAKEPISEKGPRVTSYVSLPGRYLVMMPFSDRSGGVSRKIESQGERRRLRDLLRSLDADDGSFIIRTAGLEEEESAIHEDHAALVKQWKSIKRKNLRSQAPALIHNEQEILLRLVRDTMRNDIDEILIDSLPHMKKLMKACQSMATSMADRIHLYESPKNIFDVFEVEQQFQKALRRKVWLKSGGFLIIDETEALTAIDVNSGKYVGTGDQDQVILKTNLEASGAVSRQLRLRDIGGLIVIDFIDMVNRDHQQQVLRELNGKLRSDNAKYAISGFSDFGLVEMTRKRVRMSLSHAIYKICPYCEGSGRIQEDAQIWKTIKYDLQNKLSGNSRVDSVEIVVHSNVRTYLEQEALEDIQALAGRFDIQVNIVGRDDYHHEQYSIVNQTNSASSRPRSAAGVKKRPMAKKALESA